MAFQLPTQPNYNVTPPQVQSPLEQYGKLLQLKALSGDVQMQPLRQQEAQNTVESQQLDIQQKQREQQSQQAMVKAFTDPDFAKSFTGTDAAQSNGLGFDPNVMTQTLVSKGVLPKDALALSGQFIERSQKMAATAKDIAQTGEANATIRIKGFDALHDRVADVVENPKNAAPLLYDLVHNPQLFTGVPPDDLFHVRDALVSENIDKLKASAGAMDIDKIIAEHHQKDAEAQKAQLAIAAPTPTQLTTFTTKTLPGFTALRPEQKQAFIAEASTARTVDELNKVTERADATDKAEQMHADSLAQTMALKGQTFAQQGLKENDKTWTDPQHGYLQTLSQANLGKAAIKAGADGNGLLTSLEPTMAVLGMNSFAGVHRISPAEATAAGAPGGWSERFTAWADKTAAGKLSPQLAKEGNQLFDQLVDAKYQSSVQTSAMHAKGFGIPPANMPAMDREGNLTTLDKTKIGTAAPPKTSPSVQIGQTVSIKGKPMKVTAVHTDGSFDAQ